MNAEFGVTGNAQILDAIATSLSEILGCSGSALHPFIQQSQKCLDSLIFYAVSSGIDKDLQ